MINAQILGVDPEGRLAIERSDNSLTPLNSSLFQDAVILTRLRGKLHLVDHLPPSVFSSARVDQSTAYLNLPSSTRMQTAAATINAAFEVEDIQQLRIRLPLRLLQ